jgi:hypothetical protein
MGGAAHQQELLRAMKAPVSTARGQYEGNSATMIESAQLKRPGLVHVSDPGDMDVRWIRLNAGVGFDVFNDQRRTPLA